MSGTIPFAIGVDIECIKRFQNHADKSRLLSKLFTRREIKYCFSKPDVTQHLAARFAAKEAIIKALNSFGEARNILYRDIEIVNKKNGIPTVKLCHANLINVLVTLSLSHCQDHVVAIAAVTDKVKSAHRRT